MSKGELIYEGKAKQLFKTNDENVLWVEYLNQATALNGLKKDAIQGKGELNNQITSSIFEALAEQGIQSHFIEKISKTEQLIQKMTMFPLEVVLRNYVAGSFSKRFGIEEGIQLKQPIIEFYYKADELDDPFINDAHILNFEIATEAEIAEIKAATLEINQALIEIFKKTSIKLIDFKLEFGRNADGAIVLADEISPDTCRLWDLETNEHLDKDLYRRDLGDIIPVYQEVLNRLTK
ncbi:MULTISPECIES: phosphoribosylaminoimidazolesuccinocarboxamide synthase [unclassified Enterococcus]|uniref:phosphoribosylaminoimidazolesuccinocarboxamide synthase n=1 Tax=unclassified Enterococcus TaxID=2608891 RepID=UPI00155281E2|nr:phosphoribosylaminoimidazolesuccinocarboxamide synthase [Enterococcus sp. MMGLQ5-2]MBS7584002.1 phosphoribosylaminoimidazolesuccinocarboxamide synthase [Enterococcus sp. MMGLQ5-1]NPD11863.1 phosphoribosylaminoimidazolesuccinocarboxamide synthase [Enterococcus sp. MMGLQ5-1]NPD38013.1 phosphoribosylaminoimidazolesuccinocarboxamide synthase [Enterococcus sp. MMGLQ5-2]